MSGFVTVNRLSLIELLSEERKQRAHVKKINEMKRRNGLDNGRPVKLPHIHQSFLHQMSEQRRTIAEENRIKSQKLLGIMTTKTAQPPPPSYPAGQIHRRQSERALLQDNASYLERVAHTKGIYDSRVWRRDYEEHKEHLRISKDNKLFTPRDFGANRRRVKVASSLANSKRTTPTSSTLNMLHPVNEHDST